MDVGCYKISIKGRKLLKKQPFSRTELQWNKGREKKKSQLFVKHAKNHQNGVMYNDFDFRRFKKQFTLRMVW